MDLLNSQICLQLPKVIHAPDVSMQVENAKASSAETIGFVKSCKEIRWFLTTSLNEWIEQPQPGKTTSGTLHDILYPSRASYQ